MYMKYNEWLLEWLVSYEKPSRKSRTYTKYKDIVEKRLIPRFGEYELSQITPLQVQRYIAELTENGNQKTGEGLASNSINSIMNLTVGTKQRNFRCSAKIPNLPTTRL